jgi:hypothetical protein
MPKPILALPKPRTPASPGDAACAAIERQEAIAPQWRLPKDPQRRRELHWLAVERYNAALAQVVP